MSVEVMSAVERLLQRLGNELWVQEGFCWRTKRRERWIVWGEEKEEGGGGGVEERRMALQDQLAVPRQLCRTTHETRQGDKVAAVDWL